MSAPTLPPPGATTDPGTRLLDGLEALVRRHRALRTAGPDGVSDRADVLITAEVAQQLAVARNALRRRPRTA
ncbi:hypothetical protein Ae168Ps1_1430c [Pseudonocardia sp. Ae168_Ps1]|uniref:hypothetical protein n=1 Tax=unclassified Pseudonocardia TaxID=2619320 RepID=UPI00094B1B15|nr:MULTISPECIES: hypothetical protein [unclassified Pseudonocardia]OLL73049.1 hypothetical protein Ae150APs1_1427c [Pseudonocardia sp. Ae150A_Ps1]OLL79024.1 hypothetical protein Ae168Ps1_1430c [Pseudonocardia sp. Ae168_Ps1]OLL86838.1 hypothetical protein Ae263Ps1_3893 [Pseudonocardia sp. Ae263_Ps1]OLL93118.1 hypothetical protein Ae356Ps1_3015c [Pseudonocardia sp. Ae356_Ps1]